MSYIEDLTQVLSYVAAFGCVVMSIPSILIGAFASVTGESRPYIEDLTQVLSYIAAFGCVVMSIPSILIGAIASVTGESCHI